MEKTKRERVRGRLLGMMPEAARVAEIGVWEGEFSKRIVDTLRTRRIAPDRPVALPTRIWQHRFRAQEERPPDGSEISGRC